MGKREEFMTKKEGFVQRDEIVIREGFVEREEFEKEGGVYYD